VFCQVNVAKNAVYGYITPEAAGFLPSGAKAPASPPGRGGEKTGLPWKNSSGQVSLELGIAGLAGPKKTDGGCVG